MICQDFNSLSYLESIWETIKTFNSPFDCSLEFTSSMVNISIISLVTGAVVVPFLAIYELAMSIFNGLKSFLSKDQDLKIKALDHTVTFLELPCICIQFIFQAIIPCWSLNHDLAQEKNYPRERKTIRNISIDENEILKMRDFLDRSQINSTISRSNLLALHESLK
jgi:hypothetical protein